MTDYWNDPPDTPELPECCGDIMETDNNGVPYCPSCGRRDLPFEDIEPLNDIDFVLEEDLRPPDNECHHGRDVGDCKLCDAEADLEFDANREKGK